MRALLYPAVLASFLLPAIAAEPLTVAETAPPAWLEMVTAATKGGQNISLLIEVAIENPPAPITGREIERQGAVGIERAAAAVERAVATAREPVERALGASGIEVKQRFTYQPLLRVTAGAADLGKLQLIPGIANVFIDELNDRQETLSQAARQIELAAQERRDVEKPGDYVDNITIGADVAQAAGFKGQGYAVVILDDGISSAHSFFTGKISTEACFSGASAESLCPGGVRSATGAGSASACAGGDDICKHGTHVAGIAAGKDPSSFPIYNGVATEAKLVPIQVFSRFRGTETCKGSSSCLKASNSDIAAALDWVIANAATYNIAAVNMSLGSGEYTSYCDSSSALTSGIDTLRKIGVISAVAAGNDGYLGALSAPACVRSAVAVSSVIISVPMSEHNQAPLVDLLAPGYLISSASSLSRTGTLSMSGTSMATPHVAGAVAVLKSARSAATSDQIEFAMTSTGTLASIYNWTWRSPILKLDKALAVLGAEPPPAGTPLISVLPNAFATGASYVRVMNPGTRSGTATLQVFQDAPKKKLGTYTVTVPAKSSVQTQMRVIEGALGSSGSADSTLSIYATATFVGYIQNVVWNAAGQGLTNLSACPQTLLDDKRFIGNVHTALLPTYRSYIAVHNSGQSAAQAVFDLYDSETGRLIGAVNTRSIEPNTTALIEAQDFYNTLSFQPSSIQFHINFVMRSGFTGTAQHVVNNSGAGMMTDMTMKCPL